MIFHFLSQRSDDVDRIPFALLKNTVHNILLCRVPVVVGLVPKRKALLLATTTRLLLLRTDE